MFSKDPLIQHLKRRQFIRQLTAMGGLAAFSGLSAGAVWAGSLTRIAAVRGSFAESKSRLVFDLDGPIKHSLFILRKPDRVVIDIENALIGAEIPQVATKGVIRNIRSGYRDGRNLRIVLDLEDAARAQSFLLKPQGDYGYRLVVDLTSAGHMTAQAKAKAKAKANPRDLRDVVIAIDPGHGGRDPGAVGRLGTREKDITLAIGTRLTKALQGAQGLRPVLLRKRDKFMHLRDRMDLAHESKADLLISLHADAYHDSRARGASVYALSLRGASSEAAKWVADKENAADLIGGISIRDKDDLVATVILDLAQTATIQSSLEIGSHLLDNLQTVGKVHKAEVQQAGFAVLKNPDIPSVLIETAFISNPQEERKLRNSAYQSKMSKALLKGISRYFKHKAPPGTLLSARQQELTKS